MPVFKRLKMFGRKVFADLDQVFINGEIVQNRIYVRKMLDSGAAAGDYDSRLFIADRAYQVVNVREIHQTAGSSTTASVDVLKVLAGQARASGSSVLSAVIDLSQAANAVQSPALTATTANLQLVAGDSLAILNAGTLTAVDGVTVQVALKPI